jgi:hypothetical protein
MKIETTGEKVQLKLIPLVETLHSSLTPVLFVSYILY